MTKRLLSVRRLKKYFPITSGFLSTKPTEYVKAVDDVSFDVYKGEILGIVGESGCGKSTLARLITNLIKPTDGQVIFKGEELSKLTKSQIRSRRKNIQMIFQNPYDSLDPRKTIEYLIMEPLVIHGIGTKKEREKKVHEVLEMVGLKSSHAKRYPHEFSGGQQQRINIARSIILNPDLIICDEPVSALDVSVQAQIINLLRELQDLFDLTYIFISHDLGVVRYVSDRIAVMYLGKIVESGECNEIYEDAKHPYTQALLSAMPIESPHDNKDRIILSGDVPSPINPPSGCHFHKRCPYAIDICREKPPMLMEDKTGRKVSCHRLEEISSSIDTYIKS